MILPKSNRLTVDQLAEVTKIVTDFGCKIQPIVGAVRTIYAIVGDERDELMINRIEGLSFIDRIDRIQSPFKLMDKRSDLASHRIASAELPWARSCWLSPANAPSTPRIRISSTRPRPRSKRPAPTRCAAACGSPGPIPTPFRAT